MHKSRNELFQLFQANTGKTCIQPKQEPDVNRLVGYQLPRVNRFRYQGRAD